MGLRIAIAAVLMLCAAGASYGFVWWDTDWGYGTELNVSAGSYSRENPVVVYVVNFTSLLKQAGDSSAFDANSIRLIDPMTMTETAYQFDQATAFNESSNAAGNLTFVAGGTINAGAVKTYSLYFDSGSGKPAPSYSTTWGSITAASNIIENSIFRSQWQQFSTFGPGMSDFLIKNSGSDQCNNLVNVNSRVDGYKPDNKDWVATIQSTALDNGAVRKKMRIQYDGGGYMITENITMYKDNPYLFVEASHNATLVYYGFWGTPGGDDSDDTTDTIINSTVGSYDYRGAYDNVNGEGYELIIDRNDIVTSSWQNFKQGGRYGFDLNITSSALSYFIVAVRSGSSDITSWANTLLNPVTAVIGPVVNAPVCGDDVCESNKGETESNCWDDCHIIICGDGICEGGESMETCPTDCYINIDLQQPYEGQRYSLGDVLRFRLKATTPKGLDVLDALAVVHIPFSVPFYSTLKDDGSHNDAFSNDAVYGDEVRIQAGTVAGFYNVTMNVTKWGSTSSARAQIEVRDELSTTASVSNTTFYKGYDITISGTVMTLGGIVRENATFGIAFSKDSWTFFDDIMTDGYGGFSYSYPISFADPDGTWKISLTGNDSYGNKLNETITVQVITPSQILYYGIFFSTYPLSSYTRGDEIPISVFVRKGDSPIEGANVSYKDPSGNRRFLEEVSSGYYEDNYRIPLDARTGVWALAVQAVKYQNSTLQAGASTQYSINISPMQFTYDLVEPTRFVFVAGEQITLTISVRYSNGTPVTGASVRAESPSRETLIFDETDIPGYYTKTYTPGNEENGSWSLSVLAMDTSENFALISKEILIKENLPLIPPWGWFAMAAALILSVVIWKVAGETKYYRWKFARMKAERERIETMKGIVEERYFNRRIDEETYTKLMREYEEQSVEVISKLASIEHRAKLTDKKTPKKQKVKKEVAEEKES